jgi:hypothetical protein
MMVNVDLAPNGSRRLSGSARRVENRGESTERQ